jgi:hypothetical protein
MENTREEIQTEALLRGSDGVEVAPGLKVYPVTFGTLLALRKLKNAMVADFMEGRELLLADFEPMAQFFWVHTRPWSVVQEALAYEAASPGYIDAQVMEFAGMLSPESIKAMMVKLGQMGKEAKQVQVEVIPDKRHNASDAPKNSQSHPALHG